MATPTALLTPSSSFESSSGEPRESLLAYLMIAGGVCVAVYALLFWSLEITIPALIEGTYAGFVVGSYVWLKTRGGSVNAFVWMHIACVLGAVFGVNVALGGLSGSGGFMVWGVISPLAAMVFFGFKQALAVSLVFAVLSLLGDLVTVPEAYQESLPTGFVGWITAFNIIGSTALVLVTLRHFLKRLRSSERARDHLRTQALRAQKLESLGTLAGGIAHDFNNLLMALSGNVALAKLSVTGHQGVNALLGDAEEAIKRATSLTAQLLSFSRGGSPVKRPILLEPVVSRAVENALRGSACRARLAIEDDLWPVDADPQQLEQLFQNLLLNAAQASKAGADIDISAENRPAEAGQGLPTVRVTVRDWGEGIGPDVGEKIFDPYFTTRPGASGLGLTSAFAIARGHGGVIHFETEPPEGTTFFVELPALPGVEVELRSPARASIPVRARALLMDDDPAVLRTLQLMLEKLGFDVVACEEGRRAHELYAESLEEGPSFGVVILDLTVKGGMGGAEAASLIRTRDPQAVLIASSGYTNDGVMADYEAYGFDGVLKKPYTLDDLHQVVVAERSW